MDAELEALNEHGVNQQNMTMWGEQRQRCFGHGPVGSIGTDAITVIEPSDSVVLAAAAAWTPSSRR